MMLLRLCVYVCGRHIQGEGERAGMDAGGRVVGIGGEERVGVIFLAPQPHIQECLIERVYE